MPLEKTPRPPMKLRMAPAKAVKIRPAGRPPTPTPAHGPTATPMRINTRAHRPMAFFSKRYKLLGTVGKGGAGLVYKAHDNVLRMDVAIKFLPERLARDPEASRRFRQEASTAMQLSHEHIVKLHNLEVERSGMMFLVMELVDGSDFRKILREYKRLDIHAVLQVAASCSLALDYAHERTVIHRDLKPENLMLTNDSILKIVDFGTARAGAGSACEGGWIEGSPPYMSPEQTRGEELDGRTDIYSLGVVLYELLSGHPPYPFDMDPAEIIAAEPRPLQAAPDAVAAVIAGAMAKDRNERWDCATEFYEALATAAEGSGIEARHVRTD